MAPIKSALALAALVAGANSQAVHDPVPFPKTTGTATFAAGKGALTLSMTGATMTASGTVPGTTFEIKNAFRCEEVEGAATVASGTSAAAGAQLTDAPVAIADAAYNDFKMFAGKAVVVGADCAIIKPEGEGTDFLQVPIGSYNKLDTQNKDNVFAILQPAENGAAAEGNSIKVRIETTDDGDTPIISINVLGGGDDLVVGVNFPVEIYSGGSCPTGGTGPINVGAPGVCVPNQDGDACSDAVKITPAATLTYEQLANYVVVMTGENGKTWCGTVVYTPQVRGYAAVWFNDAGALQVTGHVTGLQKINGLEGSFHVHDIPRDSDFNSKYSDCDDERSIGEHYNEGNAGDVWGGNTEAGQGLVEDKVVKYTANAQGESQIGVTIADPGELSMENLKYKVMIVHTKISPILGHELKIGCGFVAGEPPAEAPNTGIVAGTGDGARTVASAVTGLCTAALVALFGARF